MSSSLDDALEFLTLVWGDREGYVDIPTKVNGWWTPFIFRWPNESLARRRLRSSIEDGEDIYFSPSQFKRNERAEGLAMSTHWLWADLDEQPDLNFPEEMEPTLLWESSPGRFQALWEVEQQLTPSVQVQLNRAMTYTLGADPSGWDTTQVLRVPGTYNHKYEGAPQIRMVEHTEVAYDAKDLWFWLKNLITPEELGLVVSGRTVASTAGSAEGSAPPSFDALPARARRLLNTPEDQVVHGERSARLWELECLLAEQGWNDEQIFQAVVDTPWNKWRADGIGSANLALRRDVQKAMAHVERRNGTSRASEATEEEPSEQPPTDDGSDSIEPVPWTPYSVFLSQRISTPRWLVEDIWSSSSHGIIGGEPKTNKSTLALALALSVASGKPFLGKYPVLTSGPALVVQEENAPWVMQDRLRKLASYYGLLPKRVRKSLTAPEGAISDRVVRIDFPPDVPLELLNNYGYDMAHEEDRDMLEEKIDRVRPAIVVLDPLYLMLGGADENQVSHLRPFLKWLLHLRYTYGCAVILVHHWRKARSGDFGGGGNGGGYVVRAGQRLMGSGAFHGWVESAFYCERMTQESDVVRGDEIIKVEREFRNVGPRQSLEVRLHLGEPGNLDDVELVADEFHHLMEDELVELVKEAGEDGITVRALADALGMGKHDAMRRVRATEGLALKSTHTGRGTSWTAHVTTPPDGSTTPPGEGNDQDS